MDKYEFDDITIIHGNKLIDIKTKVIIIGHEHPAITIKDEVRTETYKCFLKGKYKNKTLIILPSFSLVSPGHDVLKSNNHTPYIHNIESFNIYVVEDKIYNFGKVKNLF